MKRTRGSAMCFVVLAACGTKKFEAKEEPTAGSGSASGVAATPHLRVEDRNLIEVDDPDHLMNMVVALYAPSQQEPRCSGLPIADDVVLTAAHCLANNIVLHLRDGGVLPPSDNARACEHARCSEVPSEPGAGGESGFEQFDLGTAMVIAPPPTMRIAAVSLVDVAGLGVLPPLYLASARRDKLLLVCKATIDDGSGGEADGDIDLGDSGSPLLARESGGTSVVGVVSRRNPTAHDWYFAPIDDDLPWPELASGSERPSVMARSIVSADPRCP